MCIVKQVPHPIRRISAISWKKNRIQMMRIDNVLKCLIILTTYRCSGRQPNPFHGDCKQRINRRRGRPSANWRFEGICYFECCYSHGMTDASSAETTVHAIPSRDPNGTRYLQKGEKVDRPH